MVVIAALKNATDRSDTPVMEAQAHRQTVAADPGWLQCPTAPR